MSLSLRRLQTFKALLAGSPACSSAPRLHAIINELDELFAVKKVSDKSRRAILEVLHATRTLDSSLQAINAHYLCNPLARSLGQYLQALTSHSHPTLKRLSKSQYGHYYYTIVRRRNRYMHSADSYPAKGEVDHLISSMEACLAVVVGLE
jgi:hypothetical protein